MSEGERADLRLTPFTAGEAAYAALPALARPLGRRFLLAGGQKAMKAALPRLRAAIEGSGLQMAAALPYGGDCTWAAAQRLAEEAARLHCQFIAGMGGGRALDTAKAAGDLAGMPVFTLPTIAATCAGVTRLSVLYDGAGRFDRFLFLKEAPIHCLIDLGVLAAAPAMYLRAGLGDSLAKHVEAPFAARGQAQGYADGLGLSIAEGIYGRLSACAAQALRDNAAGLASEALRSAALISIVSTGYVALLVREAFNGAVAHSLYYALEGLPRAGALLHGDMVAWGSAVQLVIDAQEGRAQALLRLLRDMGAPASLKEMGLDPGDGALLAALDRVAEQPDMAVLPYAVDAARVLAAVLRVEALAPGA